MIPRAPRHVRHRQRLETRTSVLGTHERQHEHEPEPPHAPHRAGPRKERRKWLLPARGLAGGDTSPAGSLPTPCRCRPPRHPGWMCPPAPPVSARPASWPCCSPTPCPSRQPGSGRRGRTGWPESVKPGEQRRRACAGSSPLPTRRRGRKARMAAHLSFLLLVHPRAPVDDNVRQLVAHGQAVPVGPRFARLGQLKLDAPRADHPPAPNGGHLRSACGRRQRWPCRAASCLHSFAFTPCRNFRLTT